MKNNNNKKKKELNQVTVYTIGHSNVEFEKFLSLLNGIEVLVDVRSHPFSRYASPFNKESIKRGVESAGIEYLFMENEDVGNVLGGRPNDDNCYEKGKIIYRQIMKKVWYKEAISALIELASKKGTVIMCSEEDPYKCHRHHLIAQSLLKEGITVFHIRGNGSKEKIENFQLTLI